jgi:hypothetical protein
MLHPFPGTGSSEVLGRWPYCDSVDSPWGYRLVMLHAIDEETLNGGIQNLTLVPVTGNIHGATVVLVSCRRLWTDVVQRCLISWQEEAGNFAPAVNFRLVFVVDVAMNLHSVVRELQSRRGKILVYGGFLHSARVMELLGSGVNGYVPELARRSELVKAIGALLDGQTVAPFRIPLAESASTQLRRWQPEPTSCTMSREGGQRSLTHWGSRKKHWATNYRLSAAKSEPNEVSLGLLSLGGLLVPAWEKA